MDQVDQPGVRLGRRQAVEAVEDGREEEERQEQRRDDELDVAVDRVRGGDREREPGDEQDDQRPDRNREPRRRRESGSTISASTITMAGMTTKATSWVATIESGTSCRGKRTLRIRLAFSSRLRGRRLQRRREEHPRRQAAEQKQPVVVDVGRRRLPHHREHDEVDEHQQRAGARASRRGRAPSPCTSPADRAGTGSRTARGSGTGRRRRTRAECRAQCWSRPGRTRPHALPYAACARPSRSPLCPSHTS